jgi:hypothetical protein
MCFALFAFSFMLWEKLNTNPRLIAHGKEGYVQLLQDKGEQLQFLKPAQIKMQYK